MSMILDNRKYYINSKNRTSGTNQNFNIPFEIPSGSNYDSIAVIDASIPLSFYLIRPPYNDFVLIEDNISTSIVIPKGNYNVNTFITVLRTILNSSSPHSWVYDLTFNTVTCKYTYTVTGNGTFLVLFQFDNNLVNQMGFQINSTNNFIAGSLTSVDVVSFVPTQSFFIHSDIISDNNNILQDIYTNNNTPFSFINYSCQNIEQYGKLLTTTLHSTINFVLCDASGEEIDLNGLDWNFSIMLYKKNNMTEMFKKYIHFISLSANIDI